MPSFRLIFSFFSAFFLLACSSVPKIVTEYKIDVQQGNVVSHEMVAQLRPGQTRDQVRFILGTPLLADVFHKERWDYVYRFENGLNGAVTSRQFSVYFDQDGRLFRVGGDVVAATEAELSKPASRSRQVDLGTAPENATLPPVEEKGFFSKMMEKIGL
ncbi:MAG: hypothetical protein RIR00_2484 [Pseudomonadota bacterium]|jgi:outer membrane protein assembly factor BamE